MTPEERAKALIERGNHMTVATANREGEPWVSPVFYVPDQAYDLYWVSDIEARHSENIRDNPTVAIVIFETDPEIDAVYIAAEVSEINDVAGAERASEIVGRKEQPDHWQIKDPREVLDPRPWRIYRAHPLMIEARSLDERGGKTVAVRVPADFRSKG